MTYIITSNHNNLAKTYKTKRLMISPNTLSYKLLQILNI